MATKSDKKVTVGKPTMAGLTITIGKGEASALPGSKEGFEIETQAQVARFFQGFVRAFLVDVDDKVKDHVDKAKPEAICAVLRSTDTSGATEEAGNTVNDILAKAVATARFADADPESVPTRASIAAGISAGDVAVTLGNAVPDDVKRDLDEAIAAILKGDAGPVLMASHFETKWADLEVKGKPWLEQVPPIGSKYYTVGKGTGNRAPIGYYLPNDTDPKHANARWMGPYDYYTQRVKLPDGTTKEENQHFVMRLVATKLATNLVERLDHVRAAAKQTPTFAPDCPADIKKLADDKMDGPRVLAEMAGDLAFEVQRRVRIVSNALEICQGKAAIAARKWPEGKLEAVLSSGTPGHKKMTIQEQARSKKPFSLRLAAKNDRGETQVTYMGPYNVALVRNAVKRIASLTNDKSPIAEFLKPKPREQQKATPTPAGVGVPKIEDITAFKNTMSNIYNYLGGDKAGILRSEVNNPATGDEFCAQVVRVVNRLVEVRDMEGVIERAEAFERKISLEAAERLEPSPIKNNGKKDIAA